ncbi:MAG: hypothetical protein MMC33_007645 [Icmadophila ericetorum]|nr:hypothetical protein [Icmadophila ericetorum]
MSDKKVLVVFGATGGQGGSVIKSILGDPKTAEEFQIRAVTRDPSKPASVALKEKGCEVVAANLEDKDSLFAAIKGAYAVFAVTNFWEKMDGELEKKQGMNIADACKESEVQHLIWSSLIHVKRLTKGVLSEVHHFDAKAEVQDYITSLSIPATFFQAAFFMSNIPGGMMRPDPTTGAWTFALPIPTNKPSFPLIDTKADTGKFVKGILLNREKVLGKEVYAGVDYYSMDEIVATFKEVYPEAGKNATAKQISHEEYKTVLGYAGMPVSVHEEMLQNLRLMDEYGYWGGADLKWSQEIAGEKLTTWKEYVQKEPQWKDLK